MPQREDYLLRMIAQMGRVLAHVRRLLLEGKHAEAGEELGRASLQGGIDLKLLTALDAESLRPLLTTGGDIDRPKCAFFAEVLYLEWSRLQASGRPEAAQRVADRSLLLYSLAYDDIVVDEQTRDRVAELQEYLDTPA